MGTDLLWRRPRPPMHPQWRTYPRTHALRHTLACRPLEHGSSLKEVADVLRHRSLNTALIVRQARPPEACRRRVALAREGVMSARISLQARVDDYLAERRRLGFELKSMGLALATFTRYVAGVRYQGPLTADLMARVGAARQVEQRHPPDLGAPAEAAAAVRPLPAAVRSAHRGTRRVGLRARAGTSGAAHLPRRGDRRSAGRRTRVAATRWSAPGHLRDAVRFECGMCGPPPRRHSSSAHGASGWARLQESARSIHSGRLGPPNVPG